MQDDDRPDRAIVILSADLNQSPVEADAIGRTGDWQKLFALAADVTPDLLLQLAIHLD